jgi:hypothetical protein
VAVAVAFEKVEKLQLVPTAKGVALHGLSPAAWPKPKTGHKHTTIANMQFRKNIVAFMGKLQTTRLKTAPSIEHYYLSQIQFVDAKTSHLTYPKTPIQSMKAIQSSPLFH